MDTIHSLEECYQKLEVDLRALVSEYSSYNGNRSLVGNLEPCDTGPSGT